MSNVSKNIIIQRRTNKKLRSLRKFVSPAAPPVSVVGHQSTSPSNQNNTAAYTNKKLQSAQQTEYLRRSLTNRLQTLRGYKPTHPLLEFQTLLNTLSNHTLRNTINATARAIKAEANVKAARQMATTEPLRRLLTLRLETLRGYKPTHALLGMQVYLNTLTNRNLLNTIKAAEEAIKAEQNVKEAEENKRVRR